MTTDPTIKVAIDLSAIIKLEGDLATQAEHRANDHNMPGGLAMVALGPVANQEAWTHQYEAAEHHGKPTGHIDDEDDTWEPPLQTLCFWSEQLRNTHSNELDQRPTVYSEASYLKWALDWMRTHEPHFENFADDIAKARRRLENVLNEGTRDIISDDVSCLICETRLRRRMTHAGIEDNWWCKECRKHLAPHEFYMAAAEVAARQLEDTELA